MTNCEIEARYEARIDVLTTETAKLREALRETSRRAEIAERNEKHLRAELATLRQDYATPRVA